ncbi:phenylacetate--CoA ligase family protein [Muriicola jejuensis]|uniref:CoF synthetase n=1 Tax=Muriicola jejuensis TaxID=504488 RepID=A0A6P0UGG7_9FLAO|nr:phenylacetate--CoA ligase family protein [Muriicola jejuensis]NER11540.1 CoF synthetase [Muriicola jejuensis]
MRDRSINELLLHTIETVPYYQAFQGLNALEDFPVVNKTIFKQHFDELKSTAYLNKKNYLVYTSGSTGNPFEVYHNSEKRYRNTADTIYFGEKAGFELGTKLYYLRLWDKQYKKNRLLAWIQNMYMHSVDQLKDDDIRSLLKTMERDRSTKSLLAYSSALQSIFKYLDAKISSPPLIRFKSVIAVAESLNDYIVESAQRYFGTKVISRYSNSENGIFAQQNTTVEDREFDINWASYHFEILDMEKDIPANPGELGRIVVTDLFNYCMPLIRYDTGDVGIIKESENRNQAPVFMRIEGRKMDLFTNTKGEYISSHIIHHILQFKNIEQFQFVEEENNTYIIKLKVTEEFDYQTGKSIINRYKQYFGEDSIVEIEYVQEIPLLKSGKRKLVINKAINAQRKIIKSNKENMNIGLEL